MFKNLSLGMKLGLGFGSLILLTLVVGLLAVFGINSIIPKTNQLSDEFMPMVENVSLLKNTFNETQIGVGEYFLDGNPEKIATARTNLSLVSEQLKSLKTTFSNNDSLTDLITIVTGIEENITNFNAELNSAESIYSEIANSKKVLETTSSRFLKNCDGFITTIKNQTTQNAQGGNISAASLDSFTQQITMVNEISALGNTALTEAWKLLAEKDEAIVAGINRNFGTISTRLDDLQNSMGQASSMKITMTKAAVTAFQSAVDNVVTNWQSLDDISQKVMTLSRTVNEAAKELEKAGLDETKTISTETTSVISAISIINIIGLAAVLAIGLLTAFSISRGLTKSINKVIKGLNRGSELVTVTANEVASASTALASGASNQASSVEEVSASLEEMSSMTVQNADNSKQANALAQEARNSAEEGNIVMTKMSQAIHDIKNSADETAKIIKNIDEIAFQTNLLALNAAVEAARAGEAGKGFAVVAEEVRNLAQRSATAARDTSDLIIQSQENSKNGVKVSEEVASILTKIVDNTKKVSDLLGEVATASNEQSGGIQEINSAVASMDKIIQNNASYAEQSSASSSMLKEQAEELNILVAELVSLVDGGNKGEIRREDLLLEAGDEYEEERQVPRQISSRANHSKPVPRQPKSVDKQVELDPDQVIPLDDDDLSDF